ncbi:hypothetical protein JAO29_00295 [Edaphobacter sp. HDX4]
MAIQGLETANVGIELWTLRTYLVRLILDAMKEHAKVTHGLDERDNS